MAFILHGVGARPNFVKMAPVIAALRSRSGITQRLVHTGQHYDARMSDEMFTDLGMPEPDVSLGVGSGSHGEQTGRVLIEFERVLRESPPDLVVVAGDVNSTLACALAAAKLGIPIAHVEAGLRSEDWTMPEEINRVLTDRLADLLFTHSPEAPGNLAAEGIAADRVHPVGNTMIDSLLTFEPRARERAAWAAHELDPGAYVLVTLHRPSNVDEPTRLAAIARELATLAGRAPVLFPMHPRTRARLETAGLLAGLERSGVVCGEPVGYIDFLSLTLGAGAVLTDSGGVQEETTALGVRCYTLRANTERPVTISQGTNTLLGEDAARIARVELGSGPRARPVIEGWDGHAGERIAAVLEAAVGGAASNAAAG
jgi:UDP-N-acetylglucosamine 2-epimerase (non-hydrolysing)